MNSPWLNMPISSKRRVDYNISLDIFWIKTEKGCFGLYLATKEKMEREIKFQLKGIEIHKIIDSLGTKFIFILKNSAEWEIFLILCKDLIASASSKIVDSDIVDEIFKRLNQWKRTLSENVYPNFSFLLEMGLFGELLCLNEKIIPIYGVNEAIKHWTGPDFKKQDFIMKDKILEVKTYVPTHRKSIKISSIEQLYFNREVPLYINAIALQKSEFGLTIENLIDSVLKNSDLIVESENLFELKLINYGYFQELHRERLNSFKILGNEIYFVDENFPRIKPEFIPSGILSINYEIDLWKCQNFLVDTE